MFNAGPVLTRLRAATAQSHALLEENVDAVDRLCLLDDRRALVRRYYEMHASADFALQPWLAQVVGLDSASRQRTPDLAKDLGVLEVDLPRTEHLADVQITSVPEALGFLYVLEGSTLGGRVIRKALTGRGADLVGLTFLDPYGEQAGARWKDFVAVLEREAANDMDAAVSGALSGFRHAAEHLGALKAAA